MTGESDPYDEPLAIGESDTDLLKSELSTQKKLAEELLARLQYLQADFENFRRQFEKEKASIIEHANEALIGDLLVIIDDFERAIPLLESEKDREGIALIAKRYSRILNGYGLQPIESVGKKFDPFTHEVFCTEEREVEEGTILEELEKGYRLKDKVIRPAKVRIAKKTMEKSPECEGEING